MTYHQQLQHPLWQKKRLEVLEDRGFECESCGEKEKQLHVHHPYYRRGAMIWEYEKEELRVLCGRCHKNEHAIDEKIRKLLASLPMEKMVLVGFLKGLLIPIIFKEEFVTGEESEAVGFVLGQHAQMNIRESPVFEIVANTHSEKDDETFSVVNVCRYESTGEA